MSTADTIRQGLIARGIEPHIAEAFLWNFQHESGLNPTVVERVPNVHGTRGRGLYQLTGSRRNAYEGRYGDDYSIDNQLDWLMYELQGPESAAWSRIQGAQDTGQAAAAIVRHFLRPAAQHRDRRIAEYTGGSPPQISDAPNSSIGRPVAENALALPSLESPRENALGGVDMPQQQILDPRAFMSRHAFTFTPVQV
jgi:hypothetical protein